MAMGGVVGWCDIPVTNLKRAIQFYSAVLGKKVAHHKGPGFELGILPHGKMLKGHEGVGGCLFASKTVKPSRHGVTIYISVEGRLEAACKLVTKHKGKVLQARHSIAPHGFRALILDSEGNRIALHSNK